MDICNIKYFHYSNTYQLFKVSPEMMRKMRKRLTCDSDISHDIESIYEEEKQTDVPGKADRTHSSRPGVNGVLQLCVSLIRGAFLLLLPERAESSMSRDAR